MILSNLARKVSLFVLAVFFVAAGCAHFAKPQMYMAIMPPRIPKPEWMVAISGLAEIAGGLGIAFPITRPAARWGLVLLLVAVFPANIYMAQYQIRPAGMNLPNAALWVRLALQPLLIWWVLWTTKAANHAKGLH